MKPPRGYWRKTELLCTRKCNICIWVEHQIFVCILMSYISLRCMKFVYIPLLSLREKTPSLLFMLHEEKFPPLLIEYFVPCHSYCIIALLMKVSLLCKIVSVEGIPCASAHCFRIHRIFSEEHFSFCTIFLLMQYDVWCNAMRNDVMIWCNMMFMSKISTHTKTHPDSGFP